jgi:hypothetical protein
MNNFKLVPMDSGQVGATEPVAKANENGWSLHKSAGNGLVCLHI